MFKRCVVSCNVYDPLFLRQTQTVYRRFKEAMEAPDENAMSREASLDIDERGPAWYCGKMVVARREIRDRCRFADFVVEIRDARLPFTTANLSLEESVRGKPKLLVFNKADLANEECNAHVQRYCEAQGHHVLFTAGNRSWRDVCATLQRFVMTVIPQGDFKTVAYTGLVVGMPNVGKSTFINSLRLSHETTFSRSDLRRSMMGQAVTITPGDTKQVEKIVVSREPPLILVDTPGVTMAGNFNKEAGLKLSACEILPMNPKSGTMNIRTVAHYLYECLVAAGATEHLAECLHLPRAPANYNDLMHLIADRGAGMKTDGMNIKMDNASMHLLKYFRQGYLGRITFDRMPPLPQSAEAVPQLGMAGSSSNYSRSSTGGDDDDTAAVDDADLTSEEIEHQHIVHHVETLDAAPMYPDDMRSVMEELRRDGGVISRKQGPIVTESAQTLAAHTRIQDLNRVPQRVGDAQKPASGSGSGQSGPLGARRRFATTRR